MEFLWPWAEPALNLECLIHQAQSSPNLEAVAQLLVHIRALSTTFGANSQSTAGGHVRQRHIWRVGLLLDTTTRADEATTKLP